MMSDDQPKTEPSRVELLAELAQLRREVEQLRDEKADLETMLDTMTEHGDAVSEELLGEKSDLETMLEVTTEHSDAVEEELHRKAEEALRESERRLRLIVQATPVPVMISRMSDREILYANQMAGPLLGLSTEEVLGRKLTEFYQNPAEWKQLLERLVYEAAVDDYEMQMKKVDNTPLWVTVALRPLEFNDEESVLTALHDITERKQGELRLEQQVEELRLELDEARQSSQVAQVTGTAYFRNLDAATVEQSRARRIAIHSFRGGTGKSSLTANMAALLAAGGQRVGVIDTDIQSPGVHLLFGLTGQKYDNTLNDLLGGNCSVQQAAYDVTPHLGMGVPGQVFLIPASINPGQMAQVLSQGYDAQRLTQSFHQLAEVFQLETLFIDTHPGLNEEALLSMSISDALGVVLCPDPQDYEGTGVTIQVARKLRVPYITLIVNKVPGAYSFQAVKSQVEQTYDCQVCAVLPYAEEMTTFDGNGMFVLRYPDHPVTAALREATMSLMKVRA